MTDALLAVTFYLLGCITGVGVAVLIDSRPNRRDPR